MLHTVVACLACAVLVACAGGGAAEPDAPGDVECPMFGRYLPLETGNTWSYAVTDVGTGDKESKTQTVGPLEDVGGSKAGTMAFRLTTTKIGGMVTSWQEDAGDMILRHREIDGAGAQMTDEIYLPNKVRVDETLEHTTLGASWDVNYQEVVTDSQTKMTTTITKSEHWNVVSTNDIITVGAGSFCALKVRRTSMSGAGSKSDKTYWFTRGVGKIKEEGTDQIELLTTYSVR